MKRFVLALLLSGSVVVVMMAQTTILDFETPETSTVFQYFGSSIDGTLNSVVANPDASGENTSSMVANFVKPAVAEVWAGAFSNPNPMALVDLTSDNQIAVKVYMDHIGSLSLKLEQSTSGGDNWIITVPNTKVNEWETIIFDPAIPSIEAPNTPAIGHVYQRIVLFFDFGTGGTGTDVTSYFDDFQTLPPPPVVTTILDFEAPETNTVFQYFGSPLDGTFTTVVSNPDASGINTSANVTEFTKPAVAEVWAGAFSNPNPNTPVTLDPGSQVCISVRMPHIGNLALKLEQGTSGQANWVTQVSNTLVNEWEQICFDPTAPSIEAPFEPASGAYQRIVLFFDFGVAGNGSDIIYHFDDIVVVSTGAPQMRTVHFTVDMNQYSENFNTVYLSGTFNNWSGEATPLADPEFDGIWEGDIQVVNGAYEYKVTLDNWAAQEEFGGLEECTRFDPSGQFVNRLLLVSGDRELDPFCYNSCYACGEEVQITMRLGFGEVDPSPDGVWLAGGGNFEIPGGRFQMEDPDSDGVYEITFPRANGFSSFYTFTNGNCPDYSCKEDITGQSCADPDNFNDRFLEPVTSDYVLETCFGNCSDNTDCTTATKGPDRDAFVFALNGNPAGQDGAVLQFGHHVTGDRFVTVTSSVGLVIHTQQLDATTYQYPLVTNDWAPGIYFVTVAVGDRYYTRKLIR